MPSPNVLDLSPTPRRNQTGLEKVIEGYAEGRRRGNEADELKNIYEKYKEEGMGLEQKIQEIRTNPKIGNATKASAVSDLTTIANINAKKQEMALKEYEKDQKVKAKIQEQENNKQKIADIEKRRNLEEGSLSAYQDDPKMAEQISRPPREGKGNQADRPIAPDQLQKIQDVENNPQFEKASNADKQKMLRNGLVSKENIDSVMKPYIEEGKPGQKRQEVLAGKQAEEDIKFVADQTGKIPSLKAKQSTIESADVLNEKGVTGQPWDQAMQKAGLLQYTSEGYREFSSYAKEMIKNQNIKNIVGSQISQLEFQFFRDATISERFSKEANRQILKKEKLALRMEKLYADITEKILAENEGDIPERIQTLVNREFENQSKKLTKELKETSTDFNAIQNVPPGKVLMYDKKRRPLHVPANEVEKYSKPPYGATLS